MNWYIISQVQERRKWEKFPPNRQREFPFMHGPGYQRKAKPFLGNEAPEGYDIDYNLYHVTTNLSGVINSQRLKSRKELGGVVGLGGGWSNEASHLVSVTYSYDKASSIYYDMKFVCKIVAGDVLASEVFNYFDLDYVEEDDVKEAVLVSLSIDESEVDRYWDGDMPNGEFNALLNLKASGSKSVYAFWKRLEEAKAESVSNSYSFSSDFVDSGVTGFTGSFEDMKKINPSQIAILQLVAKKGINPHHVPEELELRFRPQDLRIVRYLQP